MRVCVCEVAVHALTHLRYRQTRTETGKYAVNIEYIPQMSLSKVEEGGSGAQLIGLTG